MPQVKDLADVVEERSKLGKNFGVFVIPEGLVECGKDKPIEAVKEDAGPKEVRCEAQGGSGVIVPCFV